MMGCSEEGANELPSIAGKLRSLVIWVGRTGSFLDETAELFDLNSFLGGLALVVLSGWAARLFAFGCEVKSLSSKSLSMSSIKPAFRTCFGFFAAMGGRPGTCDAILV